jgi:hypothetical protein
MADHGYGRFDMWRNSAATDLAQARELAALLELRARDPDQMAARAAYFDLVGVATGCHVLEVGCGSGAVTRDVGRRVLLQLSATLPASTRSSPSAGRPSPFRLEPSRRTKSAAGSPRSGPNRRPGGSSRARPTSSCGGFGRPSAGPRLA